MRANWHELAPLTQGFYTNYVDSDVTMAGYRDNYGANFERLVALKAKYDPTNLFFGSTQTYRRRSGDATQANLLISRRNRAAAPIPSPLIGSARLSVAL